MRVKFIKEFRWKPTVSTVIRYRAGVEQTVTRRCGAAAVASGHAKAVRGRKGGAINNNSRASEAEQEAEAPAEGSEGLHQAGDGEGR